MPDVSAIPVGTRGYDALDDPVPMSDADKWQFRTFYIAKKSQWPGKITDGDADTGYEKARVQRHLDARIAVLLNFESSTSAWRDGAAGGTRDGAWSARICDALGYPNGLPVLVSFDEDVTAQTLPTAVAYGVAFLQALGGRWEIGAYAELSVIKALQQAVAPRPMLGWHVMATAWDKAPSGVGAAVHVEQRRPTTAEVRQFPYLRPTPTTWSLDANTTVALVNMWLPSADPIPDIPPLPTTDFGSGVAIPTAPRPVDPNRRCTVNLDLPYLQVGVPDQEAVGFLQKLLNELSGANLKVDNNFGPITAAALTAYQRFCQLVVDGECGPQSWTSLLTAAAARNWAA